MSVKDSMNTWARKYVDRVHGYKTPEGTDFTFDEEKPSAYYCETCGPDPYYTYIRWTDTKHGNQLVQYYGTLGEIIQEVLSDGED